MKDRQTLPSYARERGWGSETAQTQCTEQYVGYPKNVAPYIRGTVGAPCRSSYMYDVVTPDFLRKQRTGNVVFSPMSKYGYETSGGSSKYEITIVPPYTPVAYVGGVYTGVGNYLKLVLVNNASTNTSIRITPRSNGHLGAIFRLSGDTIARATNEAALKARTIPSDASLLVTLAESKQALMMLPSLYRNTSKLFATINSRYSKWLGGRQPAPWGMVAKNLKDEAEFLTDLWLSIRFGLRPLLSDIAGIQKALSRARKPVVARETVHGSSRVAGDGFSEATLPYGCINFKIREYSTESVSVRATTLWEAKADVLDDLGLNIANIPLAIVDLTAFSFVLNWMLTLNEYVSALGAVLQPGWKQLGGCVVTRHDCVTTYTITGATIPPSYPGFALTCVPQGVLVVTERKTVRVPGIPQPQLTLRPRPLAWLSDLRLADAAALLAQQARGAGVSRLAGSVGRS